VRPAEDIPPDKFETGIKNHEGLAGMATAIDDMGAEFGAPFAALVSIQIDPCSALRGFIAGVLQFGDASELHFREFVNTSLPEPVLMYAYHYQDANYVIFTCASSFFCPWPTYDEQPVSSFPFCQ
jgi:hypothetical protein